MDTRSKVLDWPQAERILRDRAGHPDLKVVVGYFDPLLASHARRLREIAAEGRVLVLVTSPAHPLLPAAARAELVAGLKLVEHVVVAPPAKLREALRLVPAGALTLEQASDAQRTEELVRQVHARQQA